MKVKIRYGDWENHYARIYWAYVTDTLEKKVLPHHLYNPCSRIDYTNANHSDYKKLRANYPLNECEKWCKEKGHEIVERKKVEDN